MHLSILIDCYSLYAIETVSIRENPQGPGPSRSWACSLSIPLSLPPAPSTCEFNQTCNSPRRPSSQERRCLPEGRGSKLKWRGQSGAWKALSRPQAGAKSDSCSAQAGAPRQANVRLPHPGPRSPSSASALGPEEGESVLRNPALTSQRLWVSGMRVPLLFKARGFGGLPSLGQVFKMWNSNPLLFRE